MKEIEILCMWETKHKVEVPDDYVGGGSLDHEWADQVSADGAELVDWQWMK